MFIFLLIFDRKNEFKYLQDHDGYQKTVNKYPQALCRHEDEHSFGEQTIWAISKQHSREISQQFISYFGL